MSKIVIDNLLSILLNEIVTLAIDYLYYQQASWLRGEFYLKQIATSINFFIS